MHLSAPFLVMALPVFTRPRTRLALPRASALVPRCPSSVPLDHLCVSTNRNQALKLVCGRRGTFLTSRPRVGVLRTVVVSTTLQVHHLRDESAHIPPSESSPSWEKLREVSVASKVHCRGSGEWERGRISVVGRRRRKGLPGASRAGQ